MDQRHEPRSIRGCGCCWAIIPWPRWICQARGQGAQDLCSFVVLDALNPLHTLSFLRHKILHVHSNNMYDNLPDEEVLRRDGRLYFVHARAYLPMQDAVRIAATFDLPWISFARRREMLEGGPDFLGDHDRGMNFWQAVWSAVRLEERLMSLEELPDRRSRPAWTRPNWRTCWRKRPPTPVSFELRRGGKLQQHTAAAVSARLFAGAGYFCHRVRSIQARVSMARENWTAPL